MDSVIDCIVYTTPALTMSISCVMSAVVLTRRNRNVQQTQLQQSRNRATVTILLFALLFGVCNGPLVVHITKLTFNSIGSQNFSEDLYTFDTHFYYSNAIYALLPAVNSATNPILYLWRMQALRKYTVTSIRKTSLRPNRVQSKRTATSDAKIWRHIETHIRQFNIPGHGVNNDYKELRSKQLTVISSVLLLCCIALYLIS